MIVTAGLLATLFIIRITPGKQIETDETLIQQQPLRADSESRFKKHMKVTDNLLLATGLPIKFWEYQLIKVVAAVLGACVGIVLKNWVIAFAGVYFGIKLPFKVISQLSEKRKTLLARQLEPALQQIATIYRINNSFEKSFQQTLISTPSPLKEEFEQLISDVKIAGMSLEEALIRLASRLDLADFYYFARIALIAQKYGGETKELMLQIPQTIRDRQLMRAELETEIAGAKQQAWILLAATPVFFVIYKVMRPDFVKILTDTTEGKMGMGVVAVLSLVSVFLIEKISEDIY